MLIRCLLRARCILTGASVELYLHRALAICYAYNGDYDSLHRVVHHCVWRDEEERAIFVLAHVKQGKLSPAPPVTFGRADLLLFNSRLGIRRFADDDLGARKRERRLSFDTPPLVSTAARTDLRVSTSSKSVLTLPISAANSPEMETRIFSMLSLLTKYLRWSKRAKSGRNMSSFPRFFGKFSCTIVPNQTSSNDCEIINRDLVISTSQQVGSRSSTAHANTRSPPWADLVADLVRYIGKAALFVRLPPGSHEAPAEEDLLWLYFSGPYVSLSAEVGHLC